MIELSIAQKIAIWALPLLFAITVHEVAHGWVASKFGDQTARLSGRLTLNPLKHIDLFGTIILPLIMLTLSNFVFGWAKPVPVDPRNFRNARRDMALVAFAGPCANILMALIWALISKLGLYLMTVKSAWFGMPLFYMGNAGIMINVVLAVLNFLPIPPLDGSKILYSVLPGRWVWHLQRFEQYSFIILLLLWVSGLLSTILAPPIMLLMGWITKLFGL